RAKKSVPALLAALHNRDAGIRRQAIQSLANMPEAEVRAKLLELAQEGSATQAEALEALGTLHLQDAPKEAQAQVTGAIVRGLASTDLLVFRAAAGASLRQAVHAPDVLAKLSAKLENPASDLAGRQIALNALVKIAVEVPQVRGTVAATLYRAGQDNSRL